MARIRSIKPEFFTSLTVAGLSLTARLTFIGLWTHVDDDGRAVDDARLIKAAIWPLDDRTAADVERDLEEIEVKGLIVRYEIGSRHYFAVRGWQEHQAINRPTRSKLPAPPMDAHPPDPGPQAITEDSLRTHGASAEPSLAERRGREQGREQGTGNRESAGARPDPLPPGPAPAAPPPLEDLPPHPLDDFKLTDAMRRYAAQTFPQLDVDFETAQFISHHRSVGSKRNSWPDAWQKWLRDSAKRATKQPATSGKAPPATRRQEATNAVFGGALARATAREETPGDPHRNRDALPLPRGVLPPAAHG